MSDDHDHHPPPHHQHGHDSHGALSFDSKLVKLLDHWIKHNEEHALNYRNWAQKAKANDKADAGVLLEEAAEMSLAINEKFEAALAIFGDK
jgi:hypothetical protein